MSKDFAALIDAARLREAVEYARKGGRGDSKIEVVVAAAEAYLATLSRTTWLVEGRMLGGTYQSDHRPTRADAQRLACVWIMAGCDSVTITSRLGVSHEAP